MGVFHILWQIFTCITVQQKHTEIIPLKIICLYKMKFPCPQQKDPGLVGFGQNVYTADWVWTRSIVCSCAASMCGFYILQRNTEYKTLNDPQYGKFCHRQNLAYLNLHCRTCVIKSLNFVSNFELFIYHTFSTYCPWMKQFLCKGALITYKPTLV